MLNILNCVVSVTIRMRLCINKYVPLQSDYYEGVLRSLRSGVLIVMLLARHDG